MKIQIVRSLKRAGVSVSVLVALTAGWAEHTNTEKTGSSWAVLSAKAGDYRPVRPMKEARQLSRPIKTPALRGTDRTGLSHVLVEENPCSRLSEHDVAKLS
jgi:hypothetical protein